MASSARLVDPDLLQGVDGGGMRMTASAWSSVDGSRRNLLLLEDEGDARKDDGSEGEGEVVREKAPESEGDVHDDEVDIRRA